MLSFRGTIKLIYDTQQVSDRFKKREFVIAESNSPYPQEVIFQLSQEKVDLINDYKVGEEVDVNFNLRGRAWTNPKDGVTRYFNSLEAWKIARVGAAQPQSSSTPAEEFVPQMNAIDDDLPF
jgi:hypothetical protein